MMKIALELPATLNVWKIGKLNVPTSVIESCKKGELEKLQRIAKRRKADTLVLKRNEIRYPVYHSTRDTIFGPVGIVGCFTPKQKAAAKGKKAFFEAYVLKDINGETQMGKKFDIMI